MKFVAVLPSVDRSYHFSSAEVAPLEKFVAFLANVARSDHFASLSGAQQKQAGPLSPREARLPSLAEPKEEVV